MCTYTVGHVTIYSCSRLGSRSHCRRTNCIDRGSTQNKHQTHTHTHTHTHKSVTNYRCDQIGRSVATLIIMRLSLTWPVERVARSVVVVSLIKGQPDVCGTFRALLEHQARHVAPQLEGSAHRQPHGAQRQVAGPVHYLVGQVTFVPLLDWKNTHTHTHTHTEAEGGTEFWDMQVWSSQSYSSQTQSQCSCR